MDAEVVLDGGEPVDDPTILFRPARLVTTLADQVPHANVLTRSRCNSTAGIAGAEERSRRGVGWPSRMASTQATRAASIAQRAPDRLQFCRGLGGGFVSRPRTRGEDPIARGAAVRDRIKTQPATPIKAVPRTDAGKSEAQQAAACARRWPALCPRLGKLRVAQSPPDAAQIARQAADHRTGITRPVLEHDGKARLRLHQLGVGGTRVETRKTRPTGRLAPPSGKPRSWNRLRTQPDL